MLKVQIEFLVSWFFFVTARYLCRLCTKVWWEELYLSYSSRIWMLKFKYWRERRGEIESQKYSTFRKDLLITQRSFLFGPDSVCGVCIQNTNHVASWHLHLELFSSSKWNSEICRYICHTFFITLNAIKKCYKKIFFCVSEMNNFVKLFSLR